jgi:hypothetical protein
MAPPKKKPNYQASSKKRKTSAQVMKQGTPWGTIVAVAVVVVLAASVFGFALYKQSQKNAAANAVTAAQSTYKTIWDQWAPSSSNTDPSKKITGITIVSYPAGQHVQANQRVAYTSFPPFGGAHDQYWATCSGGYVYKVAVRNENMVHALEHGAVWIAYNPTLVTGANLQKLVDRVQGHDGMMLSPYPNLDHAVSIQSWGHQVRVDSVTDVRIDEFIGALLKNPNTYPEVGASCDALGAGAFDPTNPPAFDGTKPGADAVPLLGNSTTSSAAVATPTS